MLPTFRNIVDFNPNTLLPILQSSSKIFGNYSSRANTNQNMEIQISHMQHLLSQLQYMVGVYSIQINLLDGK